MPKSPKQTGMIPFFYQFMNKVSNSGYNSYIYIAYGKDYEYFLKVWGDKLLKKDANFEPVHFNRIAKLAYCIYTDEMMQVLSPIFKFKTLITKAETFIKNLENIDYSFRFKCKRTYRL